MKKALALDIGGTKIFAAVVNEKGEIEGEIQKYKTPKSLDEIKSTLKDIISKSENMVDIVTIATAGAVNNENSAITSSTGNLVEGYNTIEFGFLSKRKVFVENDANSAAWAEHAVGAAKSYSNSITVTLGTGVGSGIIIENKLLKGKSGAAGEMHFKMSNDQKRKCTCGAWDCWEIYASGNGLRLTGVDVTGKEDITTYDIMAGVEAGDATMKEVFDIWQRYIINGLVGLANIFDPDCIVLSGSMAEFVDTEFIQWEVNKQILTQPTKILHASAGNYAGMIGSALLGISKL
ncbi:ROK family protein [bacterium]|nr:ROK family protein [bacterium]